MIKAGPFMQMEVFGIGDGSWFPVDRFERGDPQGFPLLYFCSTSGWHEDVPKFSSPVLLERDEEARWGLCPTMPHMSVGKG